MTGRNVFVDADGIHVLPKDPDESWTEKNSYLKEVDYAAKNDNGKAKLSLVPRQIIWDIAAIREYGNNKYPDGGPDNWRSVEPDRYRDAAYRHFLRYLDNPSSVDDESGLPHLWHLACNIAFLCELEAKDKWDDTKKEEGIGFVPGYCIGAIDCPYVYYADCTLQENSSELSLPKQYENCPLRKTEKEYKDAKF